MPRSRSSQTVLIACSLVTLAGTMLDARPGTAQIDSETTETRVRYGDPVTSRYRIGAEVTATRGTCQNLVAMAATPLPCAAQEVRIVDEDISNQVQSVDYRDLQGGVRQMLIKIPLLRNGQTARAIVTFEVQTRPILAPTTTDDLKIPDRISRELRPFIGESPYISPRNRKIRDTAQEISERWTETMTDWQKVETIYDFVQEHIQYELGDDKTAVATLTDRVGDCYSMSALFVALCRSEKIPARMVWVDDHSYPEFLLEDPDGKGHWFPCQVAGARAFGEMPDTRIILQRGDNFQVPERPKDRLRYASDYLIGYPVRGGGKPTTQFIRDAL